MIKVCPYCGSRNIVESISSVRITRYECKRCGFSFTSPATKKIIDLDDRLIGEDLEKQER